MVGSDANFTLKKDSPSLRSLTLLDPGCKQGVQEPLLPVFLANLKMYISGYLHWNEGFSG